MRGAVRLAQASPSDLRSWFHGLGLAREGDTAEEEPRQLSRPSAPFPPFFQLAGASSRKEKKQRTWGGTCRGLETSPEARAVGQDPVPAGTASGSQGTQEPCGSPEDFPQLPAPQPPFLREETGTQEGSALFKVTAGGNLGSPSAPRGEGWGDKWLSWRVSSEGPLAGWVRGAFSPATAEGCDVYHRASLHAAPVRCEPGST